MVYCSTNIISTIFQSQAMQSDAPSRVSFTSLANAWVIYDGKFRLFFFSKI